MLVSVPRWLAHRRRAVAAPLSAVVPLCAMLSLCACSYFPDHYLVHPREPAAGMLSWTEDVAAGELLMHIRGARPPGEGPFPSVVVLPEGGKTAADMQGIVWDLAERGYLAIAADYERRIDGSYRGGLFTWRSRDDATAVLDVLERYPPADRGRVGLLGFSQGGVYSLLIAAYAPERVKAVVSYYPVTDFPTWLERDRTGLGQRFAFSFVRWYFRRESGARSEAEYQEMLAAASPYRVAEAIRAPVLLVHGDRDTTAPVEESRRMAARLAELGRPVELLVVPGGVHIFNFRQPELAAVAWQATLGWLDRYVRLAGATAETTAHRHGQDSPHS